MVAWTDYTAAYIGVGPVWLDILCYSWFTLSRENLLPVLSLYLSVGPISVDCQRLFDMLLLPLVLRARQLLMAYLPRLSNPSSSLAMLLSVLLFPLSLIVFGFSSVSAPPAPAGAPPHPHQVLVKYNPSGLSLLGPLVDLPLLVSFLSELSFPSDDDDECRPLDVVLRRIPSSSPPLLTVSVVVVCSSRGRGVGVGAAAGSGGDDCREDCTLWDCERDGEIKSLNLFKKQIVNHAKSLWPRRLDKRSKRSKRDKTQPATS